MAVGHRPAIDEILVRLRGPQGPTVPPLDEPTVRHKVDEILSCHPAVGMAVGVVRHGRLELFFGDGVSSIATGAAVTEDTVFRIGSITKTFTAVAVMQLREQGLVDLDAPASHYLRAFKLVPDREDWRPTTVRQLLTHTGGVPEQAHPLDIVRKDYGETVALGQRVPSLAEYYRGGLRVRVEPGTSFIYGDHSFAALGQIVEDVSGQPLDAYLREHIFSPLGMVDTDFRRSAHVTSMLATGYRLTRRGPVVVPDRGIIPGAAGSIYSTTRDMARYVAALLAGGASEHGSILTPATVTTMFSPQYQPDPRLPGIGISFFRGDLGGHGAVEHQGIVPGFNSQIWLAPDDNTAVLAFTNGSPQAVMWMPHEFGQLLASLIGAERATAQSDVPQRPDVWAELCGWYGNPMPLTDVRSRMFFGAGLEVFVRRGELRLRSLSPIPALYRGFALRPADTRDAYLFATDAFGRIAFSRDSAPGAVSLTLELMPITLRKQPDSRNPRRRALRAAGALAIMTAAVLTGRRRQRPTTCGTNSEVCQCRQVSRP